jgi:hypothetical protein
MLRPHLAASLVLLALAGLAPGQLSNMVSPAPLQAQQPRFTVELEAGPVWQSRNVAEAPNDGTATRFSLRDLLGTGPWPAGRVTLGWNPWDRHGFRLLLAPLTVQDDVIPTETIRFEGSTFPGGEGARATYTFNSWRGTYRYLVHESSTLQGWVGGTAKIRDAVIGLESTSPAETPIRAEKTDLGFVPLLHLAGRWTPSPGWVVTGELDGLAGGPGRAFDVAITAGRDLGRGWSLHTGYRTVEGGADIEEVYSFAWFHYGILGLRWTPGPE